MKLARRRKTGDRDRRARPQNAALRARSRLARRAARPPRPRALDRAARRRRRQHRRDRRDRFRRRFRDAGDEGVDAGAAEACRSVVAATLFYGTDLYHYVYKRNGKYRGQIKVRGIEVQTPAFASAELAAALVTTGLEADDRRP